MEHIHNMYVRQNDDGEDQLMINKLFIQLYKIIAERNSAYNKARLDDNYFLTWQTNSITKDMLVFEAYDDRAYLTVTDKLTRLHMTSSYLLSFEPAIVNRKNDRWKLPETLKLKSFHNNGEPMIPDEDTQDIASDRLFSNIYLPKDRRYARTPLPSLLCTRARTSRVSPCNWSS